MQRENGFHVLQDVVLELEIQGCGLAVNRGIAVQTQAPEKQG